MMARLLLALFLLFCFPGICVAWPAQVLSVQDGDTITVAPVGDTSAPISIRMYGIDAPESQQPGGEDSTTFLSGLLPVGSNVEIIPYGIDRYSRSLALVVFQKKVANAMMVRAGHAWVYPQYCKAKFCRKWYGLQKKAKAQRLGLWSEASPLPPWKWRKLR